MSKDDDEILQPTKEVFELNDLEEINSNDDNVVKDVFLNMDESDLQFQEEVEKLDVPEDTVIIEPKKEAKKKKKFKEKMADLKKKWSSLPKKKKVIIIVVTVIVLIAIIVGLFFLFSKKEEVVQNVPDVILEEDNYRYENGILYFLEDDEELGSYECTNKDEELCYVAYLTNDDDFDELKQVDEDGETLQLRSKIYNERYVFVFDNQSKKDKVIKLYDIKDSKVLDEYTEIKAYEEHEDEVVLKNLESKVGLLRLKDEKEEVIPFDYDYLGIFKDDNNLDKIVAKTDSGYVLINQNNDTITNTMNSLIVGANTTHLKTKDEMGVYSVYSYQGELVGNGDYALLLDGYCIFARDMKLYVTDYQKHPMNIEGIAVYNEDYNQVATYKNNKLVSTKQSFDAQVYDKTLTLNIYNDNDRESKTINLSEGILSANLKLINYFDGRIYFYQDEAKNELLGSYSCENKNAIDTNSNELKSCTIAKESIFNETNGNTKEKDLSASLGTIPIFNHRFAFIKDGEETIILYDLKNNDSKATYKHVDTRSYTNTSDITFIDTNNIYYIGQSGRSGKFGLAKITADNVEVQIDFDNKSIKRLGDYYVLEKDDGYYLSDVGGGLLTSAKKNPIVDYQSQYVKTLKDNKYQISGFKQDEVNDTYDYVMLYEKYYATVKDKTLSIFAYNSEEPKYVLNKKLVLDNYQNEGTLAFRLTFNNTKVTIEIGQSNNTYESIEVDLSKPIEKEEKEEESDTPSEEKKES